MQPGKYFTSSLCGIFAFFSTMLSVMPAEKALPQATDTPKPPISVPTKDSATPTPIVDRITEKTDELRKNTKVILKNNQANLKSTEKLDKMVNKIPGGGGPPFQVDTVFIVQEPAKAKPNNIFQRFFSLFRKNPNP